MKIEIKNWITGTVIYECKAETVCEAVKKAVSSGADLTRNTVLFQSLQSVQKMGVCG